MGSITRSIRRSKEVKFARDGDVAKKFKVSLRDILKKRKEFDKTGRLRKK